MKITVHNLGLVKEAEIDLKPLTIFVGPNNSGKSWLVYTLTCILGPSGFNAYSEEYLKAYEEIESHTYPPLEKAVKDVLEKGSATIDMVRFARDY